MPTCRIDQPDFLFKRFGYKIGQPCWLYVYQIPGKSISTTTSCISDESARYAFFHARKTDGALQTLSSNITRFQAHVDEEIASVEDLMTSNERNDWSVLGLTALNIFLTALAFALRHIWLRRQELRTEQRRILARRRLNEQG